MAPLEIQFALRQALQYLQAGQAAPAEKVLEQVLQQEPGNAEGLRLMAFVFHGRGEIAKAADLLERSLKVEPNSEVALCNIAEIYRVQQRYAEAEAACRKALAAAPNFAGALLNLGVILASQRRFADAIPPLQRAAAVQPNNPDICLRLGTSLQAMGRFDEAFAAFRTALTLAPASADVYNHLGSLYGSRENPEQAMLHYQRALQLNPKHVDALVNFSAALLAAGKPGDALTLARRAYELAATQPEVAVMLGEALQGSGLLDEAIALLKPVIEKHPDVPGIHNSLGNAYHRQGDFGRAIEIYRQGVAKRPDNPRMVENLALALYKNNQADEAVTLLQPYLEKDDDRPVAHFHLALSLLHLGELAAGWNHYEWRWKCREYQSTRPTTRDPQWTGEDLTGKTLLLHAEQGYGDSIQFVRYVPLIVAGKFGKPAGIFIEAQAAVVPLLETVEGVSRVYERGSPIPPCDYQATLLSLPRMFRTDLSSVPADVPYVSAPADRMAYWKGQVERAHASAPRLRVGITWAGEPAHMDDRRRSCSLAHFAPLARVPGIAFFNLQKGSPASQLASAPFPIVDFMPQVNNFAESAALMSNLDLVISVDTAPVHLAGALGKKVWLLLAYSGEWRWMRDRKDSPWYPTMRLFRQPRHGDWAAVFAEVLQAFATVFPA